MKYANIKTGKFIDRPNRFIATVEVDGSVEKAQCWSYFHQSTDHATKDFGRDWTKTYGGRYSTCLPNGKRTWV